MSTSPPPRRLVIVTDGTRVEFNECGVTNLEMRTIAELLLQAANRAIDAASSSPSLVQPSEDSI